ncbi:MAG: diguanylate cyclase [Sneathiella sp.]
MPVSANIQVVANSEAIRITEYLKDSGYAYTKCPLASIVNETSVDPSIDIILLETSNLPPNEVNKALELLSLQSAPILIVGQNPLPAKYHSIPELFCDLEIQKRIVSLLRLQIMKKELARRSATTRHYSKQEEETSAPVQQQDETKIMLIGKKSELLGEILLQLDQKSKVHVCQNAELAIDDLRSGGFDALIVIGAGQGDINLRLCNDIRADSRLFNLPVLFVLEHESNREAAYIHGASDIILNPDEMQNLYTRAMLHINQAEYRFSLQTLFKASKPLPVTDGPTGLYSFGFMMAHLKALMDDHGSENKYLSIATLNIMNLSEINEEYGYPAGDQVLRQIGNIVSFLVRGEDFCCRHKNGQFLIALPCTSKEDARVALNRVYGVTRNTDFSLIGVDQPVSAVVTMGLAEANKGDSIDEIIKRGRENPFK